MKILKICLFLIAGFPFLVNSVLAQELVYRPINPSFIGGNFYNGQWLLSSAQSQNTLKQNIEKSTYERDILEEFSYSLSRSILSQLSKEIMEDSFGESGLEDGVYEFGIFNVEVKNSYDGVNIIIEDLSNGNETEILIPYF